MNARVLASTVRNDGWFIAILFVTAAILALLAVSMPPPQAFLIAFLIGVHVVAYLMALRHPGHGLVLYALLLPFWEFIRANLVYREIVTYVVATAAGRWQEFIFVVLLFGRRRRDLEAVWRRAPLLNVLLAAYFVLQVAYIAASSSRVTGIWGVKIDYAYLFPFLAVQLLPADRSDVLRFFKVSMWIAVVLALFAIYQVHFLGEDDLLALGFGRHSPFGNEIPWNFKRETIGYFRGISLIGDPLSCGAYFLVCLLWTAPLAVYHPDGRLAHPLKLAMAILAAGMYFTFTRSAWLGAAGGFLFIVLVMIRNRRTYAFALLGLIGGAALLVATGGIDFIKVTLALGEPSARGHWSKMVNGIGFLFHHPLGIGIGKVGRAWQQFGEFGGGFVVESWVLQIGIELGIVGLALFLAITFEAIRKGIGAYLKCRDPFLKLFALGAVAAFVGMNVYGITLHAFAYVAAPYLVMLVMGVAVFVAPFADRVPRLPPSSGLSADEP